MIAPFIFCGIALLAFWFLKDADVEENPEVERLIESVWEKVA
jgi:hypothetical protein